jgi:hypothetical protein
VGLLVQAEPREDAGGRLVAGCTCTTSPQPHDATKHRFGTLQGRDPRSIRRIINVQGLIGEQSAPSRSELPVGYLAGEPLAGSADWWVETCAGFVDDGFDTLVFWPVDTAPAQVDLLASEVVAHFRRSG